MNIQKASISNFIIHQVGNYSLGEGIKFSEIVIDHAKIEKGLVSLISNSFSGEETYHFTVAESLTSNLVENTIKDIFEAKESFYKKSLDLARLLYEKSIHPSIKKGDFYIVSLNNIEYEKKKIDAIALFKAEEKSTFLKVTNTDKSFNVSCEKGISLKKIDKGCIILNLNENSGYQVYLSTGNKINNDAQYWINSFLHIEKVDNSYFQTTEFSKMCEEFVIKQIHENKNISKEEGLKLLHDTNSYITTSPVVSLNDYKSQILNNKSLDNSFDEFKVNYERNNSLNISSEFEPSEKALKKVHKAMNKMIILDNSVRIFINKKYPLIEQGFDEYKKKHYYKIYFDEEEIK